MEVSMQIKRVVPLYRDVNTGELRYDYHDTIGEEIPVEIAPDPRPLQDEIFEQKHDLEVERKAIEQILRLIFPENCFIKRGSTAST
jgi:hypothetical protein